MLLFTLLLLPWKSQAFSISTSANHGRSFALRRPNIITTRRWGSYLNQDDNEDNPDKENPYADPNYPDLEFVDYSNADYSADASNQDDLFNSSNKDLTSTDAEAEAELEALREERRVKNDEYQFHTYFTKTYQAGATFAGEWTIYQVNWSSEVATTDDDTSAATSVDVPTVTQMKQTHQVTSRLQVDEQGRWVHVEDYHSPNSNATTTAFDWDAYYKPYWPANMQQFDFRGQQGNMVCGDAWTVCQAVNAAHESVITGPFAEYRAEIGLSYGSLMRYRLKLDYRVHVDGEESNSNTDRLQLKYMTVCREVVLDEDKDALKHMRWPRDHPNYEIQEALFGTPGASGGLYDPPVVAEGTEQNYILLDLPGHATTLIPAVLDPSLSSTTWVTSLDWTPGAMRYQVDRKVPSGNDMLGLRSLELSEVQAADADEYRPRDGGKDMRQ